MERRDYTKRNNISRIKVDVNRKDRRLLFFICICIEYEIFNTRIRIAEKCYSAILQAIFSINIPFR